ncbi:fatty acyl-CoA reductase wat-like [Achroia grisella]|uniref:fatty acyl-CoA reductase wat-like n=1 Tax=Achroia grisella TaxID=688607 RepID=UPI0027D2328B|nr:fatty acyl-CoA reductase wat-like [Achroia grisella]
MNHSLVESPLLNTDLTKNKMERWVEAQAKGEKIEVDVYGKPSPKQLKDLENIRNLNRELQDQLRDLENSVRIADVENEAMNPTAEVLDSSEDHEFISANQLDNFYKEEDVAEAKEEEKRRLTKGNASKTAIQKFYKDQCVFVTGGTGFLGKVLLEKLLRSCGDVDTVYVLIRSKKGKDPTVRLHEMLDDFLFFRAHEENPKGIHKIVPIVGDMELPGLGISEEDRRTITSKITVIINAAATVKFDEKLSISTAINVKGTKEVIKLAKECRNLKAITHVSTAFSNTHVDYIEEKFYEPPMSVEALEAVSELDEGLVDAILPTLLGKRPNTYCFTKAIAEEAVRKHGEGMPICIVRPSIVLSTYEEPVRGWTDSIYGPTGIIIGTGTGVLRTMYMDMNKTADMVPVDLTVNAILASAWHTAKNFKENQTSDIPIYNFVSGAQNPCKWGTFVELNRKYGIDKPTIKAVWYYGLTATNNYYMFLFYNFFLHYLPALCIDTYNVLAGRRRVMLKLYFKVMKLTNILFYFSTQHWKFNDDGVQSMWNALTEEDKAVFPFSLKEMSWERLCETFLVGLRVYIVKDDLSTLPEARKKWNRLFVLHQILKLVTFSMLMFIMYLLLRPILSLFSR